MTTSEYHCGNCPNTECVYNHLKDHIGRARKWNGKELKHVEFTPRSFTEECGCASHPSAQAALRAEGAKQERELMLIPLITWLRKKRKYYGTCSGSNANDDPEDCDPYNTVLLKIEFLRQSQSTGGEQGIKHELY